MVYLAEQGLARLAEGNAGLTLDPAWQEMLNHATHRVNQVSYPTNIINKKVCVFVCLLLLNHIKTAKGIGMKFETSRLSSGITHRAIFIPILCFRGIIFNLRAGEASGGI